MVLLVQVDALGSLQTLLLLRKEAGIEALLNVVLSVTVRDNGAFNVARLTSHLTHHTSHVIRHASHVTRHASHVSRDRFVCLAHGWATRLASASMAVMSI
jgi:hypothetical protein